MKSAAFFQDALTDSEEATPMRVVGGYVLATIMGALGAMAGGCVGYFYAVGSTFKISSGTVILQAGQWPPIIGSLIGFGLLFSLTWCYAGPGEYHYNWMIATVRPPSASRIQTVGLSSFDLYVTVHRVKNVYNTDPLLGLFGYGSNPYVEVSVGRTVHDDEGFKMNRNTTQRTCVARNNSFEEVFHFNVSPTDDTVRFVLLNQDMFADDKVGSCEVNISEEVLNAGFPQRVAYKMSRSHGNNILRVNDGAADVQGDANRLAGSIVVSFAPGANFPIGAGKKVKSKSPSAWRHMQTAQRDLTTRSAKAAGTYGTWATTSSMA